MRDKQAIFVDGLISWLLHNLKSTEVTSEGWHWAVVSGGTLWFDVEV
jgi:hypothetical protein